MATPLRLLLIEDDADDAMFIVRELRRGGYDVTSQRVDAANTLSAALGGPPWDLVTCDCVMPSFGPQAALAILREHNVRAPVIMVSGTVATEAAVAAMKAGAYDVVKKHKLARLCPVVEEALQEREARDARRRNEAALRISEARYRRLFETARDGILILEASTGRIMDVNPFLISLLGYSREEFLGREVWEISPFKDVLANQDAFRNLQQREYMRYENLPLEAKDGTQIAVEFVSNVYDEDGIDVIQCNIRTATHQTEEVIRKLNLGLEERVRERTAHLDAVNKELEAFSYSVSHDLRTPLRHIAGFGKMLLEDYADQLDEQGQDYVRSMRHATEQMQQLIEALIGLSGVMQGEMTWQPVNLSEMAQAIASGLQESLLTRRVEWVIAPGLIAPGNVRLLRVALENLFENAWKYTSKHPTARIEFGATERDEGVVYFVRDDGAGFDMEFATKLFRPFERLHPVSAFEGTGIGLATVQRIVARHFGRVWAEAEVEHGATFYFTLGSPTV